MTPHRPFAVVRSAAQGAARPVPGGPPPQAAPRPRVRFFPWEASVSFGSASGPRDRASVPTRASLRRGLAAAALALGFAATTLFAPPAQARADAAAHPLGNFTVNHYNGLRVHPDRVENRAIVDYAELPTLQARAAVDTDGSGTITPDEADMYARTRCAELAANQRLTINGAAAAWRVDSASFAYHPGQSGLQTSKLTCGLAAAAATGTVSSVAFSDFYLVDRIGWREITVTSSGVRLAPSGLPAASVSDELRAYPEDLLTSPLDQRSAELRVDGAAASAAPAPTAPSGGFSLEPPFGGPIADALAGLERIFTGLVGSWRWPWRWCSARVTR
jgi:nickel/cobalt exporter